MLRPLISSVVFLLFVPPVYAESNDFLPKIYAQKDIPEIIEKGIVVVKKGKDGKISRLLIPGEGESTQDAICDVVKKYSEYLTNEIQTIRGEIHTKSDAIYPGGGMISTHVIMSEDA